MGECTESYCKGTLELLMGPYGSYWKCCKCGHTISKKCACGGDRELTTYNGKSVSRCTKCKKYRY